MTRDRYDAAAARRPEIAVDVVSTIDWDLDNFDESMATADALVTWDLPTTDLAERAPRLRWIHIIGAGIEHLLTEVRRARPGVPVLVVSGFGAEMVLDNAAHDRADGFLQKPFTRDRLLGAVKKLVG